METPSETVKTNTSSNEEQTTTTSSYATLEELQFMSELKSFCMKPN